MQKPTQQTSLNDWLSYLETLHHKAIDLGLERAKLVATDLGLLKPAPLVITVGGTNGKGTTCRTLEMILLEAGFRVGVYSSPHLIRYNERVRIQGKELKDHEHSVAFDFIEQGRGENSLTYFEFGTLAALHLFNIHQLDVVILEVGLGGRLDSCNIIDADIAVITSIDIDHIDWLGDNRDDIAREKAGIFRAHKPAIVGETHIPHTLFEVAKEKHTPVFAVGQSWHFTLHKNDWSWFGNDLQLTNLPYPKIPVQNAATALATLYYAGLLAPSDSKWIREEQIKKALTKTSLSGRFQVIETQQNSENKTVPRVIVDVAHNPHAARYLAQQVHLSKADLAVDAKIHFVIGMLADKDIKNTLLTLAPLVDAWYFADLDVPRGAKALMLKDALLTGMNEANNQIEQQGKASDNDQAHNAFSADIKSITCTDSVITAYQHAKANSGEGDLIIVCGSFFTVAEILSEMDLV